MAVQKANVTKSHICHGHQLGMYDDFTALSVSQHHEFIQPTIGNFTAIYSCVPIEY